MNNINELLIKCIEEKNNSLAIKEIRNISGYEDMEFSFELGDETINLTLESINKKYKFTIKYTAFNVDEYNIKTALEKITIAFHRQLEEGKLND